MRQPRSSRPPSRGSQAGSTLIELIIVVTLIGILAALAMPNLINTPRRTKEAVLKTNLHTIRDSLDQYHADKGSYPTSLDTLVDDGYLRNVPLDPIAETHEWDVEYEEIDYQEPPAETDLPEDGQQGIVDVHSTAEGASISGEPYNEW